MAKKATFKTGQIPEKKMSSAPMTDALGNKQTKKEVVIKKPGQAAGSAAIDKKASAVQEDNKGIKTSASQIAASAESIVPNFPVSEDTEFSQIKDDKYEYATGLTDQTPTIIATFDFNPIYAESMLTEQGAIANLQDVSSKINTTTCLSVLNNFDNLANVIAVNKKQINDVCERHATLSKVLLRQSSQIAPAFDPATYQQFTDFFVKRGYSKQDFQQGFSNSKSWQQFLLFFKRDCVTHTEDFFTSTASKKASLGLYTIDEIENEPERYWLNWKMLPESFSYYLDYNNIVLNREVITTVSNKKFINFYANKAVSDNKFDSNDEKKKIAFLRICLTKEAIISDYLTSQDASFLTDRFGYVISEANTSLWDYIIGRFSKNTFDFPVNPTGGQFSLNAFSQYQPNNTRISTLERDYTDGSAAIPGFRYFIDTAVSLEDVRNGNFSTAKLNEFITLINNAKKSNEIAANVLGFSMNSDKTVIVKSNKIESLDFNQFDDILDFSNEIEKNSDVENGIVTIKLNASFLFTHFLPMSFIKSIVSPIEKFKNVNKDIFANFFLYVLAKAYLTNVTITNKNQYGLIAEDALKELANIITTTVNQDYSAKSKKEIENITVFNGYYQMSWTQVENDYEVFGEKNKKELNETSNEKFRKMIEQSDVVKSIIQVVYSAKNYMNKWGEKTRYTGMSTVNFLYHIFNYCLHLIANQTPAEFQGIVEGNRIEYYPSDVSMNKATITTYYLKTVINEGLINSYISIDEEGKFSSRIINNVQNESQFEENRQLQNCNIAHLFLKNLGTAISLFKDDLDKSSSTIAKDIFDALESDPTIDAADYEILANMSVQSEQLLVSSWAASELQDRQTESGYDILSSISGFNSIKKDEYRFASINDFNHVSYRLMRTFFRTPEFFREKGNNKQIVTVGIPHGLIKTLNKSIRLPVGGEFRRDFSVIKVKIYKIDRFFPQVTFAPIDFLFQIDRFPTYSLSNWQAYLSEIKSNDFNPLFAPTKITKTDGTIKLHRNYQDAFPFGKDSQNFLSSEQTAEIYVNHVKSQVINEYVRWFSGVSQSDSSYFHFGNASSEIDNSASQIVQNEFVKNNETSPTGDVIVSYKDPTSGNVYYITRPNTTQKTIQKQIEVPISDSLLNYFNQNETYLTKPENILRTVLFPKKFDRVFSIIVDPDDFVIDTEKTDPADLNDFIKSGHAKKVEENIYKRRDTLPEETNYYELFAAVEPI